MALFRLGVDAIVVLSIGYAWDDTEADVGAMAEELAEPFEMSMFG